MKGVTTKENLAVLEREDFQTQVSFQSGGKNFQSHQFAIDLIEDFIDGILLLTEQKQLIYANDNACKVLNQLHQNRDPNSTPDDPQDSTKILMPGEIGHICQALIESRHLFPNQNWLLEFDIFTHESTALHIRARWLKMGTLNQPCLLLTIEDRQQAIQNIVMEEAEKYGLTPREKEVWLLHHNNCTYKEIAAELGITPNTVKKHMKNINAKQRIFQDGDDIDPKDID